jgi:hypothetical protein
MSTRRLIAFLLGVWLGGSLLLDIIATHNLKSVDTLLNSPPPGAAKLIEGLGHDSARLLMRHQASELNRVYFENWGLAQVLIGIAVFALLLFATQEGKRAVAISLALLVLAALMRFILPPDLVNYGRQLDFAGQHTVAGEYARFAGVHRAYGVAEVVKLGLGLVLLGLLVPRHHRKRRSFAKVDAVDDADHRHVDG